MTPTATTRVSAVGIGGALAVLVAWGLSLAGIDMPAEPAAALGSVFSFLAALFVPASKEPSNG